ncbi:aquaporin-10 [Ammospiza nelsoni]|uniref:aquaporin-10 n=1 Tax=Ammospiza caudacuta TaxID=2857398 RepID=UPI002739624A|nr:aquaporin-10 [Ammospiza caudacuta]XP_059346057.1 aquaporin-10 [Ammospiza nelsoni]
MGTTSFLTRAQRLLRIRNQLVRECLGEVLSTFVMMTITLASAAQKIAFYQTKGNIMTSYLGGALGVMGGIYTAGGISGAHMNPAFSLAMCLIEQFPWWKFPIFVVVQIVGSFIAAGAVYILYYDAIWHHSNGTLTVTGPQETASIFATYPADFVSIGNGFLDQVIGTGVLIIVVMGIMDPRNKPVPKGLEPVVVALLVLSIECSMGANCGCPLNPARDIGPRLFTYLAGWGPEVFSRGNGWWWVPLVAPLLGAAVGTYLYQLFVAFHYPEEKSEVLAEQGSIVLVNTAISSADIGRSPKERDSGETEPAGRPAGQAAAGARSLTGPAAALRRFPASPTSLPPPTGAAAAMGS